jgi:hypothetical protein
MYPISKKLILPDLHNPKQRAVASRQQRGASNQKPEAGMMKDSVKN